MELKDNALNVEIYCALRKSVQLIAEKGKEAFYERLGFKLLPHEHGGPGMRKVIYI